MRIKTNFSPNFSLQKRLKKSIKFVIIHYTGMQSEIDSIERLKNIKSRVSCHYLINRKGEIIQMVEDNKVAWHAGKSKWKNFENLNENSIGIELVNKGHEHGYQNFSNIQISNLIKLCKKLKEEYKIISENFLGHSDIAPLRKLDPGEKFPWKKLSKHKLGCWYKNNHKKIELTDQKKIENLFFKNLNKIGYRYFKINKRTKADKFIILSFQKHYFPQNVSGKIDLKTLKISYFLVKELNLA
jgi:N-acetylmuramoyl-L-alanine amidase